MIIACYFGFVLSNTLFRFIIGLRYKINMEGNEILSSNGTKISMMATNLIIKRNKYISKKRGRKALIKIAMGKRKRKMIRSHLIKKLID